VSLKLKPKYISFDAYGTLVNFQMSPTARLSFADRIDENSMEDFLDDFEAYRGDEVLGAFKLYPQLVKDALKRTCARWGIEYRDTDGEEVMAVVPSWGPYPDVPAPLKKLAEHYPLVILSNASDEQIHSNVEKLGAPFHAVFTGEQAGAYKPQFRAFEYMIEKLGCDRSEILHVSSSLYYDIMPVHHLRFTQKVFVNRGFEPVPESGFDYHEVSDLGGLPDLLGL
jgi:2-haloacid dehalogenase